MELLLKRTEKGEDAIHNRVYDLSQEKRWVLILVDSKTYVSDIFNKCSDQWSPIKDLLELEQDGFIVNSMGSEAISSSLLLQQKLVAEVKKFIPENYEKAVNKIHNSQLDSASLKKAVNSSCMYINLTISQDIAKQLKSRLTQLIEMNS